MRAEHALNIYSFENFVFHVLRKRFVTSPSKLRVFIASRLLNVKRRIPLYSSKTLTHWFNSDVVAHGSKVLRYFSGRAQLVLGILNASQTVTKTA
jgi:DNA polymerase zeta